MPEIVDDDVQNINQSSFVGVCCCGIGAGQSPKGPMDRIDPTSGMCAPFSSGAAGGGGGG